MAKAENAKVKNMANINLALIILIIARATDAFSLPWRANSSFQCLSNLKLSNQQDARSVKDETNHTNHDGPIGVKINVASGTAVGHMILITVSQSRLAREGR